MRKLPAAAAGYAAALALAHYILPSGWLLAGAGLLAASVLAALLLRGDARLRALLLLLSAAAGFFWYRGCDAVFLAPAQALEGQTLTVTARVTEYSRDQGGYSVADVRLTSAGLPGTRVTVYDFDGRMGELAPGDLIRAELTFSPALTAYGEETDVYSSRGIFLRAVLESPPEKEGRAALAVLYFPKTLAKWVSEAVPRLFAGDTAKYMTALLTGDSGGIYASGPLKNALGRAGILHTVAVSGMHLSYLWGFLRSAAGNRRRAAAIGIPVLWVFAVMTGFGPSVVRAAFMLSLAAAAPFLGREEDPLSSLSAVLLILLLANPFSIGSRSLQLSFSAMAGILLATPRVHDWCEGRWKAPPKGKGSFRRFLIASFSASVGAVVFSTPLGALHFGYASLTAPLTNLLVLWVLPLCLLGGYLTVLAGALWLPLGAAAALPISLASNYIIFAAKSLAALPLAAVYTSNNLMGWWLAFTYAVFLFAYLRRGKAPFRPALPLSASMAALAAVLLATAAMYGGAARIAVLDVGQGQCIAVFGGGGTVVIDCGGMGTWENAGDAAADYLLGCGRTRVDLLVLTHLHRDHVSGVETLLARVDVDCLALPAGTDDGDGQLDGILAAAEAAGTRVVTIGEDTDAAAGGISLRLFAPLPAGEENERGLIVITAVGDYEMLVTGDVNAAVERLLVESAALPDFELLVAGHHGSRYSTSIELLDAIRAETAVISVGYNSYGHPTADVLWRLSAYGMEVLRTDELGDVIVRID